MKKDRPSDASGPSDRFGDPAAPSDPEATVDAPGLAAPVPPAGSNHPLPGTIGPYRIRSRLGSGGMGEVFLAEQFEPIRRHVALKVIKQGMDTRAVVTRFEQERQTLALMNHPAIAKVFDAGQTAEGRPYFAMEYVEGVPIREYCDAKRLGTRQRLQLTVQVCAGIQHAHQKGIIHGDLKPGNILVTVLDGAPVPKIIDFGIARATEQREFEQTASTLSGHVIGTPGYMSPEQTDPTNADIDTRADIYSLGVVLYELLVGVTPFDLKEAYAAGYEVLLRFVRENEAPRPSSRLNSTGKGGGAGGRETARRHGTEFDKLVRTLKGDLDWILLKTLEKDRNRRYETANALAMDIRRYLANEPVNARPPSTRYRAAKFIRRHRLGVIAASAVIVALLGGMTGTMLSLLRARRAEAEAQREALTAKEVSSFLADLFNVSHPLRGEPSNPTARELLARGAERIDGELIDQPAVRARLLRTIGEVYNGLGFFDEASRQLEQAVALHAQAPGLDPVERVQSLEALGRVRYNQGRYTEATSLLQEAVHHREPLSNGRDGVMADLLEMLGEIHRQVGRYDEAETQLRRALQIRETRGASDADHRVGAMIQLATLLKDRGRVREEEDLLHRALELSREHAGVNRTQRATALELLGLISADRGEARRARELLQEALAIKKQVYGADHNEVAETLNYLASIALTAHEYPEAERLLHLVLPIQEREFGPEHRLTASTYHNLGEAAFRQGRYAEGESLLRRGNTIKARVLEPTNPSLGNDHWMLALVIAAQGRNDEAALEFEQAADIFAVSLVPEAPAIAEFLADYKKFLQATGREKEIDAVTRRLRSRGPSSQGSRP